MVEERRGDPFFEEWLYKEYSIGVSLDHPGIVRVESLEDDAVAGRCIVMEWVEGEPLHTMVRGRPARDKEVSGRPARDIPSLVADVPPARELLAQLLDAVEYLHRHGVYHHDLKPSNILVTTDGRVKLIDFGLSDGAQYATMKHSAGSDGFAAPEQEAGRVADHRADIYALGGILRLMSPWRYRRAVRHAMRRDPERRPRSVAELRRLMRWPWMPSALVLMAVALVAWLLFLPSLFRHSVRLASGQTVTCRVMSRLPERRVALVSPGGGLPGQGGCELLEGHLVVPASLRLWGMTYSLTEVSDEAFRSQNHLAGLTLPEGIETIGRNAFAGCTMLRGTLVLPRSLRTMGDHAFEDCSFLDSVVWQADSCGSLFIEGDVHHGFYRCRSLRLLQVAASVRTVPALVFNDMDSLRTLHLSEGILEVSHDAFANDSALCRVLWPTTLRSVGHGAFYKCDLREVVLPDSVEVVGNYAFAYNNRVRRVVLGTAVRYVGTFAFADYYGLEEVVVRAVEPPQVTETSFDACPASVVLRVPASAVEAYRRHPVWGRFNVVGM